MSNNGTGKLVGGVATILGTYLVIKSAEQLERATHQRRRKINLRRY